MYFLLGFLILMVVLLALLLVRATRRLLQFDSLWQEMLPVLRQYGADLGRMSSGDLDGILADHPEVRAFHLRNRKAVRDIESIADSITKLVPAPTPTAELPRPDME